VPSAWRSSLITRPLKAATLAEMPAVLWFRNHCQLSASPPELAIINAV
jgi:hypothetical protein